MRSSIVYKPILLKDGKNIEEKGSVYVLGKHKPKMAYSTTLYLGHTLQAIEDLFDPKSCKLPTLVENDMPNKPMESYALSIVGLSCE